MATTISQDLNGFIRKRTVAPVRDDRQDDEGQQQKFGEGQNFDGWNSDGEVFQEFLQLQQQHAEDGDGGGDPQLIARHQRADHVGDQPGNFGGHSGFVVGFQFVAVGEPQESADHAEAERQWDELRAGKQRHRVADQSDQRKSADAAEAVALAAGAVLLALQSDQKTQEQREKNLDAFGRNELLKLYRSRIPFKLAGAAFHPPVAAVPRVEIPHAATRANNGGRRLPTRDYRELRANSILECNPVQDFF